MRSERLQLGFIALNDAAPLIVAQARGYFAEEGLRVDLVREVSWATVRDKVDVGALDGAHMLAPMALATGGPGGLTPLVAPFAMNLNGPAVTFASRLAANMGGLLNAEALKRLVARRREQGTSPITLAVVFPLSTHNYLLRRWLSRAGVDPDHDVRLTVVPPSRTAELLAEGVIEGVCVGEPWGAAAVAASVGVTAVRASEYWPRAPDKVFALTAARAAADPAQMQALLRSLLRGAAWTDAKSNRAELAALMAEPRHLGVPAQVIEASLADIVFHAEAANAPQPAHAQWLIGQMKRWGHLTADTPAAELAAQVYRWDLYAEAAAGVGLAATPRLAAFGGL
jgi:NitT/TauT family transport system ATP-binding protein/nitrate/nitrite transport system substrate-binding protein